MIKTKRGVRTLAFTLAFAMIACLVPTIALANTIELLADPSYDASTGIITVTGKITTPGADVTILALGATTGTATLSELISGKTDTQIADSISYIDQVTSDGADATVPGKFEFKFKRRTGSASGAFLNISVGGEEVAAPVTKSIEAAPNGAELSIVGNIAYYGDPIELAFTDSEEWRTAIASIANGRVPSIKIDNIEIYSQATIEAGKITLPAITDMTKTSITVTVTAEGFQDSVATVALSTKTAGTIKPQSASVIAVDEPIKFNLTGSTSWISKINTVKINDFAINDYEIVGSVLSIPVSNFVLSIAETYVTFTVTVEAPYYDSVSSSVKVMAPTTAVVLPEGIAATYPPDDLAFGDATILVPTIAEKYGTTVLWTLDTGAGAQEVFEGQAVVVPRPAEGSDDIEVTLEVTVNKGDYSPAGKIYKITIEAKGVAGINVDITLDSTKITAAALELATVTVDGVAATRNGHTFTTSPISAGTHTAVISRPGFVTKTIIFETSAEAVVDASVITSVVMIAGDVNNDGVIDLYDFLMLNSCFNKSSTDEGFNEACNFDGNEVIDLMDFLMLNNNFNYGA